METLAWLCLLLPLAGVALLALAGTWITRGRGWLGTGFAFASFVCAVVVFFQTWARTRAPARHVYTLYTWAGSATLPRAALDLVDPLSVSRC